MHFSLLQNAFFLTAECISPYCIWSLKDPAHHLPNQTEIATEEFCPKSLLQKQNEIDFIESHFQILHHLQIVHSNSISHILGLNLNMKFDKQRALKRLEVRDISRTT